MLFTFKDRDIYIKTIIGISHLNIIFFNLTPMSTYVPTTASTIIIAIDHIILLVFRPIFYLGLLKFWILLVSERITLRLLLHILAKCFSQIYTRLISKTHQYPQDISHLIGKI